MFIPHKYRDIIPPDPIYADDGSFIVPGSREWFTYMYRLELRLAADKESAAERLRIQRLEDYRRALHAEDRKTVREWKQRAAAYDGTSVIKRKEEKERLTELNQSFHRRMTTFRWANIYNQRNNITDAKRLQRLRDEMDTFLYEIP